MSEHTLDICYKNVEVNDIFFLPPIPAGRENDKCCGKEDRFVAIKDGATCILPRDTNIKIKPKTILPIQQMFSRNVDVDADAMEIVIFGFAFLFDPGELIRINIDTMRSYIALFSCSGNDPRPHTIFNIVNVPTSGSIDEDSIRRAKEYEELECSTNHIQEELQELDDKITNQEWCFFCEMYAKGSIFI